MIKRITSIVLALLIILCCTIFAYADENIVQTGDEVKLIFTIENVQNVSGVSMLSFYNSEYLSAKNIICNGGSSENYMGKSGEVRWSFIVYSGRDFDSEEIAVVTFEAIKPCTVDLLNFSYRCDEMFDTDVKPISDNPNSFFTVKAVHNGVEYSVDEEGISTDTATDYDKDSDTSTDTSDDNAHTTDTDSDKKTASDTDTAGGWVKAVVTNTAVTSANVQTVQTVSNQTVSDSVATSDNHRGTVVYLLVFMVLSMVLFGGLFKNQRVSFPV